MNRATKAALINSQANPFQLGVSFFHSTAVLDGKRRTHRSSGYYNYSRRVRNQNAKRTLLRNVSAFAEHLFQRLRGGHDGYDSDSSVGSSWFRQGYRARRSRGETPSAGGHQVFGRRDFQFFDDYDDDVEVETIFRSAFGGGTGYYYWSFVDEEPQRRTSSGHSNYRTWNWRDEDEEEHDYYWTESDISESDITSDRLALGLSASGPLNMEDVKNAYRACALKWHPDRHKGTSKAIAEEKFKVCSAAYQSLCDKLSLN